MPEEHDLRVGPAQQDMVDSVDAQDLWSTPQALMDQASDHPRGATDRVQVRRR
ncbi:hypothetical protein ACIBQ1_38705 [Nonomuraea sp. NPDC050153]|uniref:hypothetical protein n=1 Tax=Nonomuraea sp. NPDC050153 TaxID=3364359 RepID=UPI0037B01017